MHLISLESHRDLISGKQVGAAPRRMTFLTGPIDSIANSYLIAIQISRLYLLDAMIKERKF
jgi:hypothetical protein